MLKINVNAQVKLKFVWSVTRFALKILFGSTVRSDYERSGEVEICVVFTRFALKILFGSNVRSDYERSSEVEICVVCHMFCT